MKPKRSELCHPALNIVFCCMAGYIQYMVRRLFKQTLRPKEHHTEFCGTTQHWSLYYTAVVKLGRVYHRKILSGCREMC